MTQPTHATVRDSTQLTTANPGTDLTAEGSPPPGQRQLRMEVLQPQGTRGWQQPKEREDS
jgi:hypothetical protein